MSTTAIERTRIDRIAVLHAEIGGYLKMTIENAIEIGGILAEQKAELPHGSWGPWIEANLPFSARLARDYMTFYERRDELKTASVADLADARRLLTEPHRPTGEEHPLVEFAVCVDWSHSLFPDAPELAQFIADLDKNLPLDQSKYIRAGEFLGFLDKMLPWCIGDWAKYGDEHFAERSTEVMK